MAVLHSGDLESVSMGGISEYIEKLIKCNQDYEIDVYGTCMPGDYILGKVYNRSVDGKNYRYIPITNTKRHPLSVYYFFKLFGYKKILSDYDVIYAQRLEYVLPFRFSSLRKKTVFAIHGSGCYAQLGWNKFISLIYLRLEKIAIKTAKMVIVLLKREEFGLPYYRNKYKKYSYKFEYGKVPIDIDLFKKVNKVDARNECGLSQDEFIISFWGRIDDNPKRVLLFPNIIKSLHDKGYNAKLLMIGEGRSVDEMKSKLKEQKISNNVMFTGRLDHGDMLCNYISSSDVSLVLSTFEGICMSALESLACGVPVIATDVGDIHDYIKDGNNGWVIPNDNDESIVKNTTDIIVGMINGERTNVDEAYMQYASSQAMGELFDLLKKI